MTFKEKLKQEHPDCIRPSCMGWCVSCPYVYGYEARNDRPCKSKGYSCTDCWNRTIPGTEEPKTFDFKLETLNTLIERAATKKDISLSIFIREGDTHISIYPCPDPSEKKGNPVAEAYEMLLKADLDDIPIINKTINLLREALE